MRMRSHTTWAYTITLLCVLAPALSFGRRRSAKRQRRKDAAGPLAARPRARTRPHRAPPRMPAAEDGGHLRGEALGTGVGHGPVFIHGHGQGSRLRDFRCVALDVFRRRQRSGLGAGPRSGFEDDASFGSDVTARRAIGIRRRQRDGERGRSAHAAPRLQQPGPARDPRPGHEPGHLLAGLRRHLELVDHRLDEQPDRRSPAGVAPPSSPRSPSTSPTPAPLGANADAGADTCADADASLTRGPNGRSDPGARPLEDADGELWPESLSAVREHDADRR